MTTEPIDGVAIVGALLRNFDGFVNVVPVDNIKGGRLPENAPLPALLVRCVSSVERHKLQRSPKTRTVDRVSVLVRAANYRDQKRIIKLAKDCCAGKTGNIGGGTSVSILTAGTGPDVGGPGNTFEQTQDFRVSYDA